MPRSSHPQPLTTLDQLDRQLRESPRQHAQILDLDAFRRQLERASGQPTPRHTGRPADTHTTDTETQLRHELNLAFADLGGAAFALAHHGALNDKRLAPRVQRIHQLHAQLDALPHSTPLDPADNNPPTGDITNA
jgi:hypothetical protein